MRIIYRKAQVGKFGIESRTLELVVVVVTILLLRFESNIVGVAYGRLLREPTGHPVPSIVSF